MMGAGAVIGRGDVTRRRVQTTSGHSGVRERVPSVPARFAQPRIMLAASVFVLLIFGLLMVYSSSFVEAIADMDVSSRHFLARQFFILLPGIPAALVVARIDYHVWSRRPVLIGIWSLTFVFLVVVLFVGDEKFGASRSIAGIQPSEFAKITIVVTAASIAARYFDDPNFSRLTFLLLIGAGVIVPLILVYLEPDKGTTLICLMTLMVMGYLGGLPKPVMLALVFCALCVLIASFIHPYSLSRWKAAWDPWSDPLKNGYHVIQGLYAFGRGGIFGVGAGASIQKYQYIPSAYNDFIFAILGEEFGLVGTLFVLALFALIMRSGFEIARYAPDLTGRLFAAGFTSILVIQMLVNVCGVLTITPLTGKTIPFISAGGSSLFVSLVMVGLICSVSNWSHLPETEFDRRRSRVRLAGERAAANAAPELSLVGEPTPRSARRTSPEPSFDGVSLAGSRRNLSVHLGGLAADVDIDDRNPTSPASIRARQRLAERAGGRVSVDSQGRRRIDLGPDPATRLRGRR